MFISTDSFYWAYAIMVLKLERSFVDVVLLETRKSVSPLFVLQHNASVWALAPPGVQLAQLAWCLYCLPREHWRIGGHE